MLLLNLTLCALTSYAASRTFSSFCAFPQVSGEALTSRPTTVASVLYVNGRPLAVPLY